MSLRAIEVGCAPNPMEIARRLQAEPVRAFLWTADGSGPSYVAVHPEEQTSQLDPEPGKPARAKVTSLLHTAPRWVGLLPYECRRGLERPSWAVPHARPERPAPHLSVPLWVRFGAVVRVDQGVTVIGESSSLLRDIARLLRKPSRYDATRPTLSLAQEEPAAFHLDRVRRAQELIAQGQLYQVNLARRFDYAVSGDPLDLLAFMCRRTRPPYAMAAQLPGLQVVSTSPECLLRQEARGMVQTLPIKGTRPRGVDAVADARAVAELDGSPKERAELSMIVDVERNDLGRVCRFGSVRVLGPARIVSRGLVWHRLMSVAGRLRPDVDRTALLEAMLPSGSVTGAPKVRAMEIIAELEAQRRGLYTGGLGYLSHDGWLSLAMAIRTLTVCNGHGHYFAGGGIVADSIPEMEVQETLWKARQVAAF